MGAVTVAMVVSVMQLVTSSEQPQVLEAVVQDVPTQPRLVLVEQAVLVVF
jgi:hypothetical protein